MIQNNQKAMVMLSMDMQYRIEKDFLGKNSFLWKPITELIRLGR